MDTIECLPTREILDVLVNMHPYRGQDSPFMREQPGEVMALLAHAHPFLDGNGRTIMVLHAELA